MSSNIYALIPKIMGEVGAIAKDRKNPQQGYSFRGIDDVYNALQGPLAKHGVFFAPKVVKSEREERATKSGGVLTYTTLTVEFTFYAGDGSSFSVVTMGEAMDSGDKSTNKAMSAALKYALLQLFCVPTEEDNDTENTTHSVAPKRAQAPMEHQAEQNCESCNVPLRFSQKSRGWYCPNFNDKSKKHTYIKESTAPAVVEAPVEQDQGGECR